MHSFPPSDVNMESSSADKSNSQAILVHGHKLFLPLFFASDVNLESSYGDKSNSQAIQGHGHPGFEFVCTKLILPVKYLLR